MTQKLSFTDSETLSLIEAMARQLKSQKEDGDIFQNFIGVACRFILSDPTKFEARTEFNREALSSSFVIKISEHLNGKPLTHEVFTLLYRFMLEYEFRSPNGNETIEEALNTIRYAPTEVLDSLNERSRIQLRFADLKMPIMILKGLKDHPAVMEIQKLNDSVNKVPKLIQELETTLELKRQSAEALAKSLDSYRTAFNFVGLHDGFRKLADAKRKQISFSTASLFFLGLLMLTPALVKLALLMISGDITKDSMGVNLPALITVGALELLLLYFYRVILSNLKSLRAQLVQIDLRMTLCQFVQSYAEYASQIKGTDKELLIKFENIIFSGIVAETGDIPSTFDGMDQLIKLVQKTKA